MIPHLEPIAKKKNEFRLDWFKFPLKTHWFILSWTFLNPDLKVLYKTSFIIKYMVIRKKNDTQCIGEDFLK